MRYLPIHVDTANKTILVVGGHEAAEAKLRSLVKTEAEIRLVSESVSPEIKRWIDNGRITWEERVFQVEDLDNVVLAYVATENDAFNHQVATLAETADVLVNVADVKEACTFITPALKTRLDLLRL